VCVCVAEKARKERRQQHKLRLRVENLPALM